MICQKRFGENGMRLFIASPVVLEDYRGVREDFADCVEGKWVEEPQLHLTWLFLGEQEDFVPYAELVERIGGLSGAVPLQGLGAFGRPPKILYAASHSKTLYRKARGFADAGCDMERFRPHVTLCRIRHIDNTKQFWQTRKRYRGRHIGSILPQIILYESVLTKEGPKYKKLAENREA